MTEGKGKLETEIVHEEGIAAETKEAVKEVEEKPSLPPAPAAQPRQSRRGESRSDQWIPRTDLGKAVVAGKLTSIDDVISHGKIILEPEIVDYLVPDMKHEIIYIGGSPGKGGGVKRTATRITARMHKSGRRYNMASLVVVGNSNGIIGIGKESAKDHRGAIEKSLSQAKLNIISVRRGCGSWECGCKGNHSIPFKAEAKHGSVTIVLMPAPKGVGIVADDETKKMLKLAGIKDVWAKTYGQTSTRINLAFAVFEALKKLNTVKGDI